MEVLLEKRVLAHLRSSLRFGIVSATYPEFEPQPYSEQSQYNGIEGERLRKMLPNRNILILPVVRVLGRSSFAHTRRLCIFESP